MRLLDPLFTTGKMREIFSDTNRLQRMLDFEAALARALARAEVAPPSPAWNDQGQPADPRTPHPSCRVHKP